ncbi:MAG: DUF202 domain-containing protein [Sphingomonadaceae bacterium]|nr:DUF202 domain-containing protein [Sphingomonadaceae bacterium]
MMTEKPTTDDLAIRRTQLAEDRNIMAMERTFAGWIRTSFAAMGIGLAFHALFGELEPPWLAKAVATAFILAGAALAYSAQRQTVKTLDRLHPHLLERPSTPNFRLLAYAVIIGCLLVVAGLWAMKDTPPIN